MTTPALPASTHVVNDTTHIQDHNELAAAAASAMYGSNNGTDIADVGTFRANIHVPALTPAACVAVVNVPTMSGAGGATTIASGSNSVGLPQATINVAATAAFPTSGTISVVTGAGTQAVSYTGITGTTFTGCAGGTGTMSTGGAVTAAFDGYALAATDMILLSAQTTASQNGPWVIPAGLSGAWTRPTEFPSGAVVKGRTVRIINGTGYHNTDWTLAAPTAGITVDTTSQTWAALGGTGASILSGVTVSGTPAAGQVLTATSTSTAGYATPADLEATSPAIVSLLAWAFDPNLCTGGTPSAMATGCTYYVKMMVPQTINVTNVCCIVAVAGATLTIHECFCGLFSSAGVQLGVTPDVSGASYTVSSTASSATVTGTAFTSAMIGANYVITGATGTYTVTAVASGTSLTVTPAVSTTLSSVGMFPGANFTFSSVGEKIVPLVTPVTVTGGLGVYVYAAFTMNGTTPPAVQRSPNTDTYGITFGQTATTVGLRTMRSTATTTTLPASFTPGVGMNLTFSNWAALS